MDIFISIVIIIYNAYYEKVTGLFSVPLGAPVVPAAWSAIATPEVLPLTLMDAELPEKAAWR